MKGQILALAVATGLASLAATASAGNSPAQGGARAAQAQPLNRFVVELRPRVNTQHVVDTLQSHGITVNRVIKDSDGDVLAVSFDPATPPDLRALQPLASYVRSYGLDVGRRTLALDEPIPDIVDGNETIPWGITAVGAQEVAYGGGRKVCIIDTGYALGHPDLPASTVDGGIDRGAGPWDQDGYGHGTHVAGTIAARGGNEQGVVGVIADGSAELFIVRPFNDEGGWSYSSDLSAAMIECADAGANVISMSLGGDFSSPLEERITTKLQRQGVLLVAAAGNGTSDPNGYQVWYNSYIYPASYSAVLSVAAVDNTLSRAGFSQRNREIELAAPGVQVLSTLPDTSVMGSVYGLSDGTSMATPHVAGVAALVWSNFKQCSNTEIANALKKSALDLDAPGYDANTGWGLVQAPAAMEYLAANPCTGRR